MKDQFMSVAGWSFDKAKKIVGAYLATIVACGALNIPISEDQHTTRNHRFSQGAIYGAVEVPKIVWSTSKKVMGAVADAVFAGDNSNPSP